MKAGERMFSAVCDTAVVIVRAPAEPVTLLCGGAPMTAAAGAVSGAPEPGLDSGTLLGKRYVDEDAGLELLVTKGGSGTLSVEGRQLQLKAAKPLPSSD